MQGPERDLGAESAQVQGAQAGEPGERLQAPAQEQSGERRVEVGTGAREEEETWV